MKILLNLIPVRSGGGMQVAANFLERIILDDGLGHNWWVLVSKNSELEKLLLAKKFTAFNAIDGNFVKRTWYEYFEVPKLISEQKIDLVYSYGPGLPKQSIPTVTRSTYSNLYFPEINFWGNWDLVTRWKNILKDKFRLSRTLNANGLIFENKMMRERAKELFGYTDKNTLFVYPSISSFNEADIPDELLPKRYKDLSSNHYHILMLTGWHKNKNIDIVPDVLKAYIDKYNDDSIRFLITVDSDHPYSHNLFLKAKKLGVSENIIFFGRVPVNEVRNIYSKSDIIVLLSLLECFSSNIIESWAYKKPLLISKEEWSQAICENAAAYVERNNASKIADALWDLKSDSTIRKKFIENGLLQLEKYNTPIQKVTKQIAFLEEIYKQYYNNEILLGINI